jgi:AbrB family looped-hinge helix DNA binding protein
VPKRVGQKGKALRVPARITSKGQLTIPVAVCRALGLGSGDRLVFEVEPEHSWARLRKAADFIALTGSVPVPKEMADADWGRVPSVAGAVQADLGEVGRNG